MIKGILGAPFVGAKRMTMPATVRRAKPDEVVDLRWKVLRAGRPREDAIWKGDDAADTRHWLADHDGRVVGIATVLNSPMPETPGAPAGPWTWQLRGMATHPDWQGTGVGRKVLSAVERDVGDGLWCNARTTAVPFYEKAGWVCVSDVFDIPGVGPHRRMVKPK